MSRLVSSILVIFISGLSICCTPQNEQQSTSDIDSTANPAFSTDSESTESPFVSFSPTAVVGENVYVPVYSHIYQMNQQRTFNLTATLSIRNSDLQTSLRITKVYYYDSQGMLVHKYLDQAQSLAPLSSVSFVVEEEDLRGGVGANFLVLWESDESITQPVIEAVMISTSQQQGISFVSEGRTIHSLDRSE